jgi:transcriptional regulator with XRE-family HTH domain
MSTKARWLGRRLREIRTEKELSQYELAKRSGVTKQAIGRIENGVAFEPTWTTIQLLIHALGVPCTEFMEPDLLKRAGPDSVKKGRRPRKQ